MRKRIFLLISVVSLALIGCSEKESFEPSNESQNTTNVPIVLNTDKFFNADISTRATIESLSMIDTLGVFCLAGKKTTISGSENAPTPNWNVTLDSANFSTTTHGKYWNNIPCTVDAGSGDLEVQNKGWYAWYYPITSWYAYDFYAYYPYRKTHTIIRNVENRDTTYQLGVDYQIDGTQDIIWGRSEIKSDPFAYSAKYFRNISDPTVHMKLEHSLTQFQFYVLPQEKNGSFEAIKKLAVKKVSMHEVATNLRLIVADNNKNGNNRTGHIQPIDNTRGDLELKGFNGKTVSPVEFKTQIVDGVETAVEERIGDCIMVCPDATEYYMSMVLCLKDDHDSEYYSEKLMTIKLNENKPFQAGKIYKIYIKVSGITEIKLNAELADWIEADDNDNLNFDIN